MEQNELENLIYNAIITSCEEMEAIKIYKGNSHHLAQKISSKVANELMPKLPKEKQKIFY
jgi:hypothetical protein